MRSQIVLACGFVLGALFTGFMGKPALAQTSGNDDVTKKVVPLYAKDPGKGPQLPFDESRWEFWWYFNREPLIRLRETLFSQQAGQAAVDQPFQKLKQEDRTNDLVRRLVFALKDANPAVRSAAVLALAKTQEPSVRPSLQFALEDKEFTVRIDAILALGVCNNTFFLGRLEEILRDDKQEMQARFHAAIALGLIGGSQTSESFRQLLAPTLFKALPPQVQAGLAYAVGVARDPENVQLVRGLLDDKAVADPHTRAYLALALGKAGTDADLPRVYELLNDGDAQVRRSAVIGLGVRLRKLGAAGAGAEAVKKLIQVARTNDDNMTRNFAYISLGWLAGPEALRFLREELGRVNKSQQSFVALAIGLVGDPESVGPMIKAFEAESDLSTKAAFAISLGLHHDAKAAPALRHAFESAGEPVLKGHIGLALGMVRDNDAVKPIQDAFKNGVDIELLPNLANALGLLGARPAVTDLINRALKETNEFVKQSLLYSCGLIGDRNALGPLGDLVAAEKDVSYVRAYAAAALGLLGEERPVRAIAMLTIDSNYTVRQTFLEQLFAEL